MAIVKILQYPNPRLLIPAEKVTDFGDQTQQMIDDMFETHYNATNCAALAATQLDFEHPKHITVIDYSEKKDQPLCLVNAVITQRSGEQNEQEGCMSVGLESGIVFAHVKRAMYITVSAQDRHGNPLNIEAEGFFAKCIQHELDHLDGKLFLHHLSSFKRMKVEALLKKRNRLAKKQH